MASDERYSRQELLFGREGQQKIEATTVALAGVGGNGTRIAQDLAHLGVRRFVLVEPGDLKESGKNRYIGHRHDDPIPGTPKLAIAERMIRAVSPSADIVTIRQPIEAQEAEDALANAHVIFGCLDDDGPRFSLNELSAKLGSRLIDVATEIVPDPTTGRLRFGGRVFVLWDRPGCLYCCDLLDKEEVAAYCASPEARENRAAIYGLRPQNPDGSGPSVVTLNGVISSVATTEFMVAITGLRAPVRLTTYRGDFGRFSISRDEPCAICYTCGVAAPLRPLP